MRKVLLVGISTLLIVVGAIFCISWFIQSSEMKKGVEQTIARLNEKQNYITYEGITVSGFPTHIALTINNPHFSGRVDQLLNSLEIEKNTPPTHGLPEWYEDISLLGSMTFTVNALSDHYTFQTSGEWQKSSKLAGNDLPKIVTTSEGGSQCSLTLSRSTLFSNLWNYRITTDNAGEFLKEIRELDCNAPAYVVTDTTTNTALINSGPTRIFFSSMPKGTQQEVRLFVKSSDAEITAEGEKLITSYIIALSPDYPFPPLFSAYGKQNVDIDFVYNGPIDPASAGNSMNLDINLGTFNISNDVYTTKGYMRLNNQTNGDQRTALINTHFDSAYTEAYDMMIKDAVRNFLTTTATSNEPELQKLRTTLQARTPEENFAIIEPIIPNIHSLGTQTLALNASYAGNSNFMAGDYNMSEFAITATPYGITGSGTAKSAGTSPFPQAHATFICTNCMQLVDDAMHYAGRVSGVIQTFSSEPPPFFITPSLIEGTKNFLYALSESTPEEKANGHFSFTIISEPNGNVLICDHNIGDVMSMYGKYTTPDNTGAQDKKPD